MGNHLSREGDLAAKRGNCIKDQLASASLCNTRGLGLSPFGGDSGTTSGELFERHRVNLVVTGGVVKWKEPSFNPAEISRNAGDIS